MDERPSGWYDDPDDATKLRYWDGILWSDRTMPKLMPGLEHVGQARPTPPPASGLPGDAAASGVRQGQEASAAPQGYLPRRPGGQAPRGYRQPQPGMARPSRQGRPGSVGSRIGAIFLDRFLVGIPAVLVCLPFMGAWMNHFQDFVRTAGDALDNGQQIPSIPTDVSGPLVWISAVLIIANVLYDVIMTALKGATVGKMAFGLRVAPREAEPLATTRLPLGRCIVRAFVKVVPDLLGLISVLSVLGGFLQIGFLLWALSNPLRQGVDDLAARSVVRRTH